MEKSRGQKSTNIAREQNLDNDNDPTEMIWRWHESSIAFSY